MRRTVIIGIFDGVHRGHQELISLAKEKGHVIALTFDPHPTSIVAPERTPSQLVSVTDRIALLQSYGVDQVVVKEFTREFAALSSEEFISQVLVGELKVTDVIVGENFTFGNKASGNVETLRANVHGLQIQIAELEENRGTTISSTRIRHLITDGDIERAADLMTRNHYLVGPVVHGEKRGRTIGYPTANIGLDPLATIPADGIYAGWLSVAGVRWASAISIGTNPTFPGVRGRQVEAYALDQTGLDLYDQIATVEFVARLRDTLKFDGLDPLLTQMKKDCDQARDILNPTKELS